MSEIIATQTLKDYLKQLHNLYKNNNKSSLTDVLKSFNQISDDYNKFNETINNVTYEYSDHDLLKCTRDEQLNFYNDQLQLIECLVLNKIYDNTGTIYDFGKILNLIRDKQYMSVDKTARKVIFSTLMKTRPVGNNSYATWNGFQIIDLDIKSYELSAKLKPLIFENLCKYNWFLGVYFSASHKGLHIWTKITPISVTNENKRIEYFCNFRHKYSYVYIVLNKYAKQLGYNREDILQYMDMAMAKPQQGSFISYDDYPLVNTTFQDLRLDANFESAFDTGVESIDWISHPDLKNVFAKLEWFANDDFDKINNVDLSGIQGIEERDIEKSHGKRHYKHAQRWQIANTLVALYGEERGFELILQICKDTSARELKGDIHTAAIHNKPISLWAIKELNANHGFKIKITDEANPYKDDVEQIVDNTNDESSTFNDPTQILHGKSNKVVLNIKHNQYLGDIRDEIIKNLSHITLLEAGAGYGKTEMIKSLKAKTLLVLPFTSTIKAKIETSDVTKDWLYFYGNKRPQLEDLIHDNSMAMTLDKFSRLNVMELDQSDFKYIVIDESHLLFTSSYRDVMSPVIQRLANCKAKIIMMTGTPTGELLFFPNIKHIKVIKEDFREKRFELHMCPSPMEQLVEMCKSMAQDVIDGKKILFPTNKGNLYFEQVTGIIQQFLNSKNYNHMLQSFYYKKSNYGDDSMDSINIDKSIGDNDIIFCTTYLSVGVDICDKYTFSVYFNETWIPQDIEQFANRLRNNDLYLKMFLPARDSAGIPINYRYTQPLDLSFDKADLLLARDLIRTCNDMLERNDEEAMFNPLINSMFSTNRYLKYDENDRKYYIDETTYKLKVFEDRYSTFSKQLTVLTEGIKYYGYHVDYIEHKDVIPEQRRIAVEEYLQSCKNLRYNYITNQIFIFLDHITEDNIDIYKELLKGSYEIFRNDKYKEEREENNLYVEDIEILERYLPIVLTLYKFYDFDVIKDIFHFCVDARSNKMNNTKLKRIQSFVRIEANRRKKRIDFPMFKYIRESQEFARKNHNCKVIDIDKWIANYAAAYANSIPDLVVDDRIYLEEIFTMLKDIWKIIIIQTRPKNGEVTITPFDLIWQEKNSIENIYGNDATQTFFLQELIDGMREDESSSVLDEEDEDLADLPKTSKLKLSDVEDELPNVIHKEYDYKEYSEKDGSNKRFMRKQENTSKFRIFTQENNDEQLDDEQNKQPTLFDEINKGDDIF